MDYYAISEKGLRDNNEDNYIIEKVNDFYIFGIADGIGGREGGEIASDIALQELKKPDSVKGDIGLKNCFEKANEIIINENKKRNINMGTTMVAGVFNISSYECIIGNLGDSRAYIFSEKIWRTTDDSLVENLVKKGVIRESEEFGHPHKNIITKALGLEKKVNIDIIKKNIRNSIFLLCSDGLSDYVKDEDINRIVKKYKSKKACKKLVKYALKNGSKDNITIIVGNFKE